MNYWIITDTHFGHPALIEYLGRPEGYEEKILKNLSVVRKDDVLIHLGDIAFNSYSYWIERLRGSVKGKMILVRGNHDKHSLTSFYKDGWDFVCNSFNLDIYGKNILFSHVPKSGDFDINIHGHFHNNPKERWEKELVSVMDYRHKLLVLEESYRPIKLERIVKEFRISGV